jgi:probable blue pigment (indigoidine) exporter
MSSVGFILIKRWNSGVALLPMTAWQLTMGGLVMVPVALIVEGAPSPVSGSELAAFAYLSLVATLAAYVGWNTGLKHLPAGAVGLIGLLNPVTGVLLGVVLAGETLTVLQLGGIALVFAGILIGQSPVRSAVVRGVRARGGVRQRRLGKTDPRHC